MSESTSRDVRAAISAAAELFFGRPVAIEERVYQALAVQTNMFGAPHEQHVWRQLCLVVPSMATLHDLINRDFDFAAPASGWPSRPRRLLEWASYSFNPTWWTKTFVRLFGVRTLEFGKHEYTETARAIIGTGFLTVENLLSSILESGQYSSKSGKRHINAVAKRLAEARGVITAKTWDEDFERFTVEIANTFRYLAACDGSLGQQQFLLSLDRNRVSLRPFGSFGAYQFSDLRLTDGSLWVARSNVLQPSTAFSLDALEELEDLINSSANEAAFQRFFEHHDEFLLALGEYTRLHPQLILHEDGGERLVPDFFLERIDSDSCDICDLKLPSAELVRNQRHRQRFRDTIMEGVAQLVTYRDWFDDRAHREQFRSQYGLTAFRPRVVLVIGRRRSFYDDVERMRLESLLPACVQLKTYDDIVARARQWRFLAARETSGITSA